MSQEISDFVVERYMLYNTNNMERGVAGENQTLADEPAAAPQLQQLPEIGEGPQVIFWLATARKAIALKQTMYLISWLALHHLNRQSDSSGILPANEQVTAQIANLVAVSPGQLISIFDTGNGAWWDHIQESRLRIYSQEKTSNRLTLLATEANVADPHEPEVRCQMPLAILKASQREFQSFIFDAWIAERSPNGLKTTWNKITNLWSCSQAQIVEWIETAGAMRQPSAGSGLLSTLSLEDNPDTFVYRSSQTSRRTHTLGKTRKINKRRGHRR